MSKVTSVYGTLKSPLLLTLAEHQQFSDQSKHTLTFKGLVLSSTSALSTKLATKLQFWENITFCFVDILFWKKRIHFKTQNIDKISFQKAWLFVKSTLSSECSGMLDAQPTTIYPASPDEPSRNSKFGFWSEHHCIYFLTIVLSSIVAVGMKFNPTCRQRNLSSMTALQRSKIIIPKTPPFCEGVQFFLV